MTPGPVTTLAGAALAGLLAAPAATPAAAGPGPRCVILFAHEAAGPGGRVVRVSAASDAGTGPDGVAVAKRLTQDAAARTVHDVVEVLMVPLPEGSGGAWTPGEVTPATAAIRLRHTPGDADGAWSVRRAGDGAAALTARALEEMPAPPLAHFCDHWAMREALTHASGG